MKKEEKNRQKVLDYLHSVKRQEPLDLFFSPDHIHGPRWVARYPSSMTYADWGAVCYDNWIECVVRHGKVEEVS